MSRFPFCPNCQVGMLPASYGMRLPGPEDEEVYDMGCLVDFPMVLFGCKRCHFEILTDGTTRSSNVFGQE